MKGQCSTCKNFCHLWNPLDENYRAAFGILPYNGCNYAAEASLSTDGNPFRAIVIAKKTYKANQKTDIPCGSFVKAEKEVEQIKKEDIVDGVINGTLKHYEAEETPAAKKTRRNTKNNG